MAYNLSTYQNNVKFYKLGIHFLCALFYAQICWSQCDLAKKTYDSGVELYQRKQHLLSLNQFSISQYFNCAETSEKAKWGYLLNLSALDEKEESYFLANNYKMNEKNYSVDFIQKINLYNAYYFNLNSNQQAYERVQKFNNWKENLENIKSPTLAATMSAVLPGSGQAYVGTWQAGAMAFLLNSLFLSATLELQNKGLHQTALVSGIIFSITYMGNILNAAESAKTYNKNAHQSIITEEKSKQLPELQL